MNKLTNTIKKLSYLTASMLVLTAVGVQVAQATPNYDKRVTAGDSIAAYIKIKGNSLENKPVTFANAVHSRRAGKILTEIKTIPAHQLEGASVFLSTGLSNDSTRFHRKREELKDDIMAQIRTLHQKGAAMIMVSGVAEDFDSNNGSQIAIKKTNSMTPTVEGTEMNQFLEQIVAQAQQEGIGVKFLGAIPAPLSYDDVHANRSWYESLTWDYGVNGQGVMPMPSAAVEAIQAAPALTIQSTVTIIGAGAQ